MTKETQKTNVWTLEGDIPHFMGNKFQLLEAKNTHTMQGIEPNQAHAMQQALIKVIKGQPTPTNLKKLKMVVRAHLVTIIEKNDQLKPHINQLVPIGIAQLELDRECLTPQQSQTPHRPRRIKKMMADAAKAPPPVYDPNNQQYQTLGKWAYEPKGKHVFFNGTFVDSREFVAAGIGILIERFPAPATLTQLEHAITASTTDRDKMIDVDSAEGMFLSFGKKAKKELKLPVNPLKREENTDNFHLIIDLNGLTPEQKAQMELIEYHKLAISPKLGTVWVEGLPDGDFYSNHARILATLIPKKGEIVSQEKLVRATGNKTFKGAIKTLNKRLTMTFPDNRELGIHYEPQLGYVFHESNQETLQAITNAHRASARAIQRAEDRSPPGAFGS